MQTFPSIPALSSLQALAAQSTITQYEGHSKNFASQYVRLKYYSKFIHQ